MDIESLNELSIFALRELARRAGVGSPTSKRKEELIKYIIDISEGRAKPTGPKSKQGRPPKNFNYNFEDFSMSQDSQRELVLQQDRREYSYADFTNVAGFVGFINNVPYLYAQDNLKISYYYILPELWHNFDLRAGDRIVGEVNSKDNVKVIDKIFSINSCPIVEWSKNRKNFEDIKHQFVDKKLQFSNSELDINVGENVFIYGSNNNVNTDVSIKLLNSVDAKRVYLNVSVTEKNKVMLESLQNAEQILINLIEENVVKKQMVSICIERLKRLVEMGENVVLIIDDMLSITSIDDENLTLTKTLVSLAKSSSRSGSLTTIAIMPTHKDIDAVEKLADRRFKIEENKIKKVD